MPDTIWEWVQFAVVVYVAGFLSWGKLASTMETMGFKRVNGRSSSRKSFGENPDRMTQDDIKAMRARSEQAVRLLKSFEHDILDDDGSLAVLRLMHEQWLPDADSIFFQVTGQREPAWHNYTVVQQQKRFATSVEELLVEIRNLVAAADRQTQAVLESVHRRDIMERNIMSGLGDLETKVDTLASKVS